MTTDANQPQSDKRSWVRIPDGTMVRLGEREGFVDGLTELVSGPRRNPDGRTQYRVNVGDPDRKLATEDELLILTDADGVVRMLKQKMEYRGLVSKQLYSLFSADRFIKSS